MRNYDVRELGFNRCHVFIVHFSWCLVFGVLEMLLKPSEGGVGTA